MFPIRKTKLPHWVKMRRYISCKEIHLKQQKCKFLSYPLSSIEKLKVRYDNLGQTNLPTCQKHKVE